jgi:hypothetical protein
MNILSTYFKKINKSYTMIQDLSEVSDDRVLSYGEVIVYNDGTNTNPEKCKVGDGESKFGELNWLADTSELFVTARANNMLSGTKAVLNGEVITGAIPTVGFDAPTIALNESTGKITASYQQNIGYSASNTKRESEKDLGISTLTVSTPTMDAFGIVNVSYSSTKGYTTGTSDSKTLNLNLDPKVCTYSVEEVSGAPYGFARNADDYWESQNDGINNSYAICKVHFKEVVAGSTVVFDVINYAQAGSDYAIFSKWNTELSLSSSADSTTKCQAKFNSYLKNKSTPQQVVYKITENDITNANGDLWIAVKFIKNSSTSSNNDNVAFKVANGIEKDTENTVIALGFEPEKSITLTAPKATGSIITATSDINKIYKRYQRESGPGDAYGSYWKWGDIPWTQIGQENGGFSTTIRTTGTSVKTNNLIFYGGTEPLIIVLHMAAGTAEYLSPPQTVYPSVDQTHTVFSTAYITYNPLINSCFSLNTYHQMQAEFLTYSAMPSYDTTCWLKGNVEYCYDDRNSPAYREGYWVEIGPPWVNWQNSNYNPYNSQTYGSYDIDPTSDKIRYWVEIIKPDI